MNWHKRYKEMKNGLGYTNSDIAEITGNTADSVKSSTQPNGSFPRNLKLAIIVYEKFSNDKELTKFNLFSVAPRSFGMVRWYGNTHDDIACVSIAKAREYVEKYNKLSGKEDCYVDEDIYKLLNEV